jgi:hypothetical protein
VLDEEATVRLVADTGLWVPILHHGTARALDLALVVDTTPSMAVWHDVLREFRLVLERLGAFRDVRSWRLQAGPLSTDPLTLATDGSPAIPRDPGALREPVGRRLILVASDCTGEPWRDGRARDQIAAWGRTQHVVLLQALPPPFWRQTGLGFSTESDVCGPRLAPPNVFLKPKPPVRDVALPGGSVLTPVVWIDPVSMAAWARMLTSPGSTAPALWIESEPLDSTGKQAARFDLSAEERVRRFASNASRTAQELAAALAVAPLTLPVIRLVQRTQPRPSRDVHVAEVLLGGLVRVTSPPGGEPQEMTFEFHQGVRKLLLNRLGRPRGVEVIGAVSRYLADHFGSTLEISALLADPEGFLPRTLGEHDLPFAHITALFLRRLGDRFARIAERLESGELGVEEDNTLDLDRLTLLALAPSGFSVRVAAAVLGRDDDWTAGFLETLQREGGGILTIGTGVYSLAPPLSQRDRSNLHADDPAYRRLAEYCLALARTRPLNIASLNRRVVKEPLRNEFTDLALSVELRTNHERKTLLDLAKLIDSKRGDSVYVKSTLST